MEGDTIEVNTINEALDHFGVGTLNGKAFRNACGKTTIGNDVLVARE
jgi:hypothetical protein